MGNEAPQVLNAGEYWQILKRRKKPFLIPFIIVLSLAAALAMLLPPTYRSEATILVERQEIPEDIVGTTVTGFVQERIESITQKVLTTENLLDVANNIGIETGAGVNQGELVKSLRQSISVEMVDIEASDPGRGRATTLTVAFVIAADAETPAKANKIAKRIAELYLEENRRLRIEQASDVSQFIDTQSELLRTKITDYEARLATFKQEQIGQLPEQAEMNQTLLERTDSRIDATEEAIRSLQNQKRTIEAQMQTIDKYVARDADPEKANSALERLAIARQQLNEAKQKYSDLHPTVKRMKSEITSLESEVRAQTGGRVRENDATNPEYVRARSQLAAIRADLAAESAKLTDLEAKSRELSERLLASPLVEKEYTSLVRELDASRQAFSDIERKRLEAELASNLEQTDKGQKFTLLEPASMPGQPESPNRIAIFAMGVFLAGLIGLGFALIAEISDKTIRGARSLSRILDAPPIGIIPRHQPAAANTDIK